MVAIGTPTLGTLGGADVRFQPFRTRVGPVSGPSGHTHRGGDTPRAPYGKGRFTHQAQHPTSTGKCGCVLEMLDLQSTQSAATCPWHPAPARFPPGPSMGGGVRAVGTPEKLTKPHFNAPLAEEQCTYSRINPDVVRWFNGKFK